MANIRTFIAIELIPAIQDQLTKVLGQLKSNIRTGVKWVQAGNIHLTLKFIGDFPEDHLSLLKARLEVVISKIDRFEIEIKHLGAFPNLFHPKVIWVGVENNPALLHLVSKCDEITHAIGVPLEDRGYSPHLTLGRVRPGLPKLELSEMGKMISATKIGVLGSQHVESLTIFKSVLGPSGAAYTALARLSFRPPQSV